MMSRQVRAGGRNVGKTRAQATELRAALVDAKMELYRQFLELGSDAHLLTAADQELLKALLQDTEVQERFAEQFRKGREKT